MIDGHILKEARIARHLTQSALAEGITTRTRIGLIENNKTVPHEKMLRKIISRLNLNYDQVVLADNHESLRQIDDLTTQGHYIRARADLEQVKIDIENEQDTVHVAFLNAYLAFHHQQNISQAINNFNKIILTCEEMPNNLFDILAMEQLGVIYFSLGNEPKMQNYFRKVRLALQTMDIKTNLNWTAFIYNDLAHYYAKLNDLESSNQVAKFALAQLEKANCTHFVDTLSFTLAENFAKLSNWQNVQATNYLIQASTFAKFSANQQHVKKFNQVLNTHRIAIA